MSSKSHQALIARNGSIAAGIRQYVTTSVTIGGTLYSPSALQAVFDGHTTALKTADASYKKWLNDVVDANAAEATTNRVYVDLKRYLLGQYGAEAHAILNAFGIEAPKSTMPTVAVKAAATVKRKATRAARHTMGKNQKKAVTGNVTGIVVTPITAETTPSSDATTSSS
jgi:hypothetical protein